MSGGGGTTTTEQNNDPWSGVQPYLEDLFKRAFQQSGQPLSYYPGKTYADRDPLTQQYYDAMTNLATNGTAIGNQGEGYISDVLGGKYLGEENPYLDEMVGNLTQTIGADIGDRFAASGGYMGSPGEQQTVAREVSQASIPYLFQAYNQERGAMDNASKTAALYDQLQKGDLSGLLEAGQANEAQQQKGITEAVQRYEYGQQAPWDILSKYSQLIQPGTQFSAQSSEQSQSPDYVGATGAGVGAASSLALLAFLALSDRRLKKDIKFIGYTDYVPFYCFKYLWENVERIGTMFDDVIWFRPDAVKTYQGFGVVDYGRLLS